MSKKLLVRRAAVLGAGVMGAQIAAHLANAGVDILLFDLPAKQGDPNGIVLKAIANLAKLSPAPLAAKDRAAAIVPANYDQHLDLLQGCDLIVEAIAERLDWKKDLYAKIAPHVAPTAILASNTSGLSINALADVLDESLHERFCGLHFFNPPRYMHLAELIPCRKTSPEVLDAVETFLTSTLGKGVVRAKDTPNFIGNRIGVFSMLSTMHHTGVFGLGFDAVDALTGPAIGRPKSATYRTADVVGLDTMAHVIQTMADTLPDDPWHKYFAVPPLLKALIEQGALGQKTGAGIYRKLGKDIQVLDVASQDYRISDGEIAPEIAEMLKIRNPAEKFAALRASAATRRRNSCGRSSATCSITAPSIWRRSPTPRATSTSRSAGATAGSWAPSRTGRRLAGNRLPAGLPKTSRRARRCRTRRFRHGYSTGVTACMAGTAASVPPRNADLAALHPARLQTPALPGSAAR